MTWQSGLVTEHVHAHADTQSLSVKEDSAALKHALEGSSLGDKNVILMLLK